MIASATSSPPTPIASMPSEPPAGVCESEPIMVLPGIPNRCMCVGCETPLPGLEYQRPNLAGRVQVGVVLGVLLVGLEQVVVDVLHRELRVGALQAQGLELLHHQRAGGVLGKRLVDPQRHLLTGVISPSTRCVEMSFWATPWGLEPCWPGTGTSRGGGGSPGTRAPDHSVRRFLLLGQPHAAHPGDLGQLRGQRLDRDAPE